MFESKMGCTMSTAARVAHQDPPGTVNSRKQPASTRRNPQMTDYSLFNYGGIIPIATGGFDSGAGGGDFGHGHGGFIFSSGGFVSVMEAAGVEEAEEVTVEEVEILGHVAEVHTSA